MKRILTLVAAGALALAPLAGASASTHRAAAQRVPGSAFLIIETNGGFLVSTAGLSQSAGTPVVQREAQSGLTVVWTATGSYLGNPSGYLNFVGSGNYLAASDSCNGATIKSTNTSNGTIWAIGGGGGNVKLVNRYCDQQNGGHNDQYLEGDGHQSDQYKIGDTSGYFINMTLSVPSP